MANSLATTEPSLIANEMAQVLESKFPVLEYFSKNYTQAIPASLGIGGSFVVKNLGNPSTSYYTAGVGFAQSTASMTDTTITINKYAGSKIGFNTIEMSSPIAPQFIEGLAQRATYALAKTMITDILSVVTSSNFSQTQTFASSSGISQASVISSGVVLDNQGVTDDGRIIVVNPTYYGALLNDPRLFSPLQYALSANVAATGKLLTADNFSFAKADPTVFNATFDGTNKLVGFAAHPSAIAFASITPPDPTKLVGDLGAGANVQYGFATSPRSGVQIVVAKWYDPVAEMLYILPKVVYGVSAGVANALQAYVSPSAL